VANSVTIYPGVSFQKKSSDRKLSPVAMVRVKSPKADFRRRPIPQGPHCSSTYVSISSTCPTSCVFKDNGCYVTSGFTASMSKKLDAEAADLDADEVIQNECATIDSAFPGLTLPRSGRIPQDGARGGRDLRLHVGGDVGTQAGVKTLASAAHRWLARGGGTVWTYTHRWRKIPRSAWGEISVLASVEKPHEMREALARGYAPAITLREFPSDKAFELEMVKVIPCPAETFGTTCVECRLCLDRDLVRMKAAIGFAVHGFGKDRAARRLPVL
jgi:hypothetical protein